MLVTLIFAESLLDELIQCDLSGQDFDVDAQRLTALLYNALNDLMMVERHEEMQTTKATISEHDSALDILNANDTVDLFEVVARKYGVGGRIELVERAWCHLERHRQFDTRPVILLRIEALTLTWTFGKLLVELEQCCEHIVLVFA